MEMDNEASPTDVLHLNVGGTKTTVLRRTLTSIPGSMLASKFSGRWDDSIEKDKDGDFFIERDYELFRHVLTFLRNKANGEEKYPVRSPDLGYATSRYGYTDLVRMLDYYELTDEIFPVTLKTGSALYTWDDQNSKKVNATKWASFLVATKGHDLRIKTFEVTLGTVERVQIGWNFYGSSFSTPVRRTDNRPYSTYGIGEFEMTFALDLTRSSYLSEGKATPIDHLGLNQIEGSVVRSEDFGRKWYVNGELIVAPPRQDWCSKNTEAMLPFISVAFGEIEVTSVEFDI